MNEKCPGHPAYDNCSECELTSESCHPSYKSDDRKKLEEIRMLIVNSERELEVSHDLGMFIKVAEQARVYSHAWERIKMILEVISE